MLIIFKSNSKFDLIISSNHENIIIFKYSNRNNKDF